MRPGWRVCWSATFVIRSRREAGGGRAETGLVHDMSGNERMKSSRTYKRFLEFLAPLNAIPSSERNLFDFFTCQISGFMSVQHKQEASYIRRDLGSCSGVLIQSLTFCSKNNKEIGIVLQIFIDADCFSHCEKKWLRKERWVTCFVWKLINGLN